MNHHDSGPSTIHSLLIVLVLASACLAERPSAASLSGKVRLDDYPSILPSRETFDVPSDVETNESYGARIGHLDRQFRRVDTLEYLEEYASLEANFADSLSDFLATTAKQCRNIPGQCYLADLVGIDVSVDPLLESYPRGMAIGGEAQAVFGAAWRACHWMLRSGQEEENSSIAECILHRFVTWDKRESDPFCLPDKVSFYYARGDLDTERSNQAGIGIWWMFPEDTAEQNQHPTEIEVGSQVLRIPQDLEATNDFFWGGTLYFPSTAPP